MIIETKSAKETYDLGKKIGSHAKAGEVYTLVGDLGGTVRMNGKTVKIRKPLDAMKHGISYLPEDRKHDGIIGDLSVKDNIILALQVMRGMFRPISKADAAKYADEYIKLLEIKTASPDTPIKSLSGGNQQKVILARWLLANPVYLILEIGRAHV